MFDVAGSLMNALSRSRERLGEAAAATSRAQTPYGPARTDAGMAGVAEKAIFQEALMNAMHSRLAEIKSVTHG
ncbi:MAG TPA: hypothetical protein VFN37_14810 [Candidatus Baltobacteraceae bacterium]|nr:hypothetical protein [Candidatus Baltobacteraceae bacterium]HET9097931.1 hypothetical protein [Candidatus Baltobacteraceae bacterium]